jgi:transposase-like protein
LMEIDAPIGRAAGGARSFSFAFRVEFVRQWDQAVARGAKTALLREHGLTRNTVAAWLRARDRGDFQASMVKAAGKSRNRVDSEDRAELARLRLEVKRLQGKVDQAEAVQEILGKAFGLLEGITKAPEPEEPQIPVALMSAQEYARWLQRSKLS